MIQRGSAILATIVLLLAFAVAVSAQETVELEFWGWWASATRMPTIEKIVNTWNEGHPDAQVKYTFVPYGDILTKYLASVAAGSPPDAVVVPDIFTTPFRGQRRQAMDLSALGADRIADQFYDSFWDAVQYQGRAYALPWVGETKYLYYNKDHFADAGLNAAQGPATWDDLWNFSDKLDQWNGRRLLRAGFHPLFGNFGYQGWVWNAGSLFFDERGWPTVNSEKNIEVLEWVKEWTDRYDYRNYAAFKGSFGGGPQHPFIQERVSMINETATWEGELKNNGPDIQYGIARVPTPDGIQHQNASYTGGFAIEVPVGTNNPQEAFAFATYWATEAAVVWAEEQNDFPAYKRAVEVVNTPEFQRMADNMQYTGLIPLPLLAPNYLVDVITPTVDDVIAGNKSPQDALAEAQAVIVRTVRESVE